MAQWLNPAHACIILDAQRLRREGTMTRRPLTTLLGGQPSTVLPLQHRGAIIGLIGGQGLRPWNSANDDKAAQGRC